MNRGRAAPRGAAQVRRSVAILAGVTATLACSACKPYRTEYRTRPAFYSVASEAPLPDELELEDGTRVVYREARPTGLPTADPDAEAFRIREESPSGKVTLRCMLPEHVIANTMTCLRNEEYDLIWSQLLAKETRARYAKEELDAQDFAIFLQSERRSIMETLNRMGFGFFGPDVVLERAGGGVIRARFSARLAEQFRFRNVDMVMEPEGLKLLLIH